MFSLATNNFQSNGGMLQESSFLRLAGQPKLCYYGESGDEASDDWTVVVPCPHPGFVSQNPRATQELLRFFLLTFGVGWLAISLAMDAVDRDPHANRRSIAESVRGFVERQTDVSTPFGIALADARAQALQARNLSQRGAGGQVGRPRQARRAADKELRQKLAKARLIAHQQPVQAVGSKVSRMQVYFFNKIKY